jgi:hypothetical protein
VGLPLTPEQAQAAKAIDILRTKCMLKAERWCRKLRMGAIQFSPTLAKAIKDLAFWDVALRPKFPTVHGSDPERQQRAQLSSRLWRRKKKAAGIRYKIGNMSKEEMEHKQREAKEAYVKAKCDHEALCTKFLDTLPEKDRVGLQRHEEQGKMGRSAKWITGKLESKSVTKVEWQGQEMTSRDKIEHTLLEVNWAKTRLSEHTPFLQHPLVDEFGYQADNANAQAVLDGTYTPPARTPPNATQLLAALRTPHNIRIRKTKFRARRVISTDDHIKAFRRAKERTSAGMSNLHFGMFKAHISRRPLAELDACMCSVAYAVPWFDPS